MKPKILFFDEPTSALDPELTAEILKVIQSLTKKDMTMVIVSHEIAFAKKISDCIIFNETIFERIHKIKKLLLEVIGKSYNERKFIEFFRQGVIPVPTVKFG